MKWAVYSGSRKLPGCAQQDAMLHSLRRRSKVWCSTNGEVGGVAFESSQARYSKTKNFTRFVFKAKAWSSFFHQPLMVMLD